MTDVCSKCTNEIPAEDFGWCLKCEKDIKRCPVCNSEMSGNWCSYCQLENPEIENLDEDDMNDGVTADDLDNGGYPT